MMLRLKEILKEKGLTEFFIAKAMNLNVVTIYKWASGTSMPTLESLIKLCDILDKSLDDLVKMDLNLLIHELSSIENIQERRNIIFSDIHSPNPRFKAIADESPHLLFEILGGNESNIVAQNWAIEYYYEDYLEENDVEFDEKESKNWNLEERSIQNALDVGYWDVTGECLVECENGGVLVFEFQYTEGCLNGIIGTPYNINDHGNHGIPF